MIYYDEDNNPVDNVITREEAETEYAEKLKQLEEENKTLKEKEKEYNTKDFNFSKFRNAEKTVKDEMVKNFDSEKRLFIEKMSDIEGRLDEYVTKDIDRVKEKALESFAGTDDKLKTEIENAYESVKQYKGQPKNEEEALLRLQTAYKIVTEGKEPPLNPLNFSLPSGSFSTPKKSGRFTDTPQGQAIIDKYFT